MQTDTRQLVLKTFIDKSVSQQHTIPAVINGRSGGRGVNEAMHPYQLYVMSCVYKVPFQKYHFSK